MFGRRWYFSVLMALILPLLNGCDPVLEERKRDGMEVEPFAPREYIRMYQPEIIHPVE